MSLPQSPSITVEFLSRFTASEQFDKVFREGMSLVEETANYLDGPGRTDARTLDRNGAVAYATESMRLTTRLMQLASWLLLQRAAGVGEGGALGVAPRASGATAQTASRKARRISSSVMAAPVGC